MDIKSLIISVVSLCILSACAPTKEERAQEMAATYLKGVLYHFDSYEPLQTNVDSSFVSLLTDKEAIEQTINLVKLFQLAQEYVDKVNESERSMEIWSPIYSTAHSKGEYRRAKEERDKNQQLLDRTKERIDNQFSKIKKRQAVLKEGEFDGWRVCHKFKSLNGSGTLDLLGEYIFFCDEEFKERSVYPKEEYDDFSKIIVAISQSENILEMVEKLQDEIY